MFSIFCILFIKFLGEKSEIFIYTISNPSFSLKKSNWQFGKYDPATIQYLHTMYKLVFGVRGNEIMNLNIITSVMYVKFPRFFIILWYFLVPKNDC